MASEGETPDTGIVVGEADDLRLVEARQPHEHAVEARERLIAVARDRAPPMNVGGIEARPAPLILVPVPVPDENVHQAGGQKRARVHPVARAPLEVLEQLPGIGEIDGPRDRGLVVGSFGRALFDHAQLAGLRAGDTGEAAVVRQDEQPRLRIEHAGGVEQRGNDQRGAGVGGADLILDDRADERGAQLGRECERGVLVDGAERVLAPIRPREVQCLRLAPTAAPFGCEPPGVAGKVEYLYREGRPP